MHARHLDHVDDSRSVSQVVTAVLAREGAGFSVRRPFPTGGLDQLDPFLLLDEMGPVNWAPGQALGAPDHPHRGFETVTYLLEGAMQHRDSGGHVGDLGPGDVQWMTAGSGVVHSELPHPEFKARGGRVHGFQFWVNLPARLKMSPLRYRDISTRDIPEASSDNGRVRVRVIAGEALGQRAAVDTLTPITLLHFRIEPGGRLEQPLDPTHNAAVYVFNGEVEVGAPRTPVKDGQLGVLTEGGAATFSVADDAASAAMLLFAGAPIAEPVVRHGPFVMNTQEEILTAIRDYQAGRMGEIRRP